MSRGHVAGTLQTGVQPLQAFPTGQSLNGYAEHVYEQPEGEPPVETNSIRAWRDWPGLRNGQTELRLNNQRAPRVHGLGWGFDADANVWRPTAVDGSGRGISSAYSYGYDPTTGTWIPVLVDPTGRVEANSHGYGFDPVNGVWLPLRVDSTGAVVTSGTGPTPLEPPTAQLSAWYRAGDINQASGSSIYTWADRSGNGADLVGVPGSNLPQVQNNAVDFNLQTVATFDGTQQLYRLLPPGFASGDSAISAYLVSKPLASFPPDGLYCFAYGDASGAGKAFTAGYYKTGSSNRLAFVLNGLGTPGGPFYNTNSGAQILSISLPHGGDLQGANFRINGLTPTVAIVGGSGTFNLNNPVAEMRMGSFFGSYFFTGQIAELLIYHKNHNTAERDQTLEYLSQRYAIPV